MGTCKGTFLVLTNKLISPIDNSALERQAFDLPFQMSPSHLLRLHCLDVYMDCLGLEESPFIDRGKGKMHDKNEYQGNPRDENEILQDLLKIAGPGGPASACFPDSDNSMTTKICWNQS